MWRLFRHVLPGFHPGPGTRHLALGLVLFTALDDAARALHPGGGCLEDELDLLVAAALMVLLGLVGLLRRTSSRTEHERAGHHVAR